MVGGAVQERLEASEAAREARSLGPCLEGHV